MSHSFSLAFKSHCPKGQEDSRLRGELKYQNLIGLLPLLNVHIIAFASEQVHSVKQQKTVFSIVIHNFINNIRHNHTSAHLHIINDCPVMEKTSIYNSQELIIY